MYVVAWCGIDDKNDPWAQLQDLKKRHPALRCTIFAIPGGCSTELLQRYEAEPWIELGAFGYHGVRSEAAVWGYDEATAKLEELEEKFSSKVFMAPDWMCSEGLYQAIVERGWTVLDHATYAYTSKDFDVHRWTYAFPGNEGQVGGVKTFEISEYRPDGDYAFVSHGARPIKWGWSYADEQDVSSWSHKSGFGVRSSKRVRQVFADKTGLGVDFGGNDGTVPSVMREILGAVYSIEGSPERAEYSDTRYGIPAMCADLENLPFYGQHFDWGYCSHVLEHLNDPVEALNQMKEMCRRGIYVVLPVEDKEHFEQNPAHQHMNSAKGWCEMLDLEMVEDCGFDVIAKWENPHAPKPNGYEMIDEPVESATKQVCHRMFGGLVPVVKEATSQNRIWTRFLHLYRNISLVQPNDIVFMHHIYGEMPHFLEWLHSKQVKFISVCKATQQQLAEMGFESVLCPYVLDRSIVPVKSEQFTVGILGEDVPHKGFDEVREVCRENGWKLLDWTSQPGKIPWDRDIEEFYRDCSVVVCNSQYEGGPLPPMEALARGRAAVSTRVGMVADLDPCEGLFYTDDGLANTLRRAKDYWEDQERVPRPTLPEWVYDRDRCHRVLRDLGV